MEALRRIAKISFADVERLAGLKRGHYWAIQKRGTDPELDAVRKVSALFGCTVGYLAAGEGEPPDPAAVKRAVVRARKRLENGTVASR